MSIVEEFPHLIRENESLAPYCWLQLGGTARYFAEPNSVGDLQSLIRLAHDHQIPVRLMGDGSNILVRDEGIDALVIRLVTAELCRIEIHDQTISARAGAKLNHVISAAVAAGLGGVEHVAGIPGTVGAAVAGNAGVINDDLGSRVARVQLVQTDGELRWVSRNQMQFGFRRSNLQDGYIAEVELALEPGDATVLTRRMQSNWIIRRAAQPCSGTRTVQAFIEPDGIDLTEALEQAGVKGAREGEAVLSPQHAGFISVSGAASSQDVLKLIEKVTRAVEVQTGIQLQSQLKIW